MTASLKKEPERNDEDCVQEWICPSAGKLAHRVIQIRWVACVIQNDAHKLANLMTHASNKKKQSGSRLLQISMSDSMAGWHWTKRFILD